jgi:hypothetical protein
MDRLHFEVDPAVDVTMLYRQLTDGRPLSGDLEATSATWVTIGAALDRALALVAAAGCSPAALEAVDMALVKVVRAAVDGQRTAFDAGLRAGAALAALQPPSRN